MAKKTKLIPPWEQDPVCKSGRPRKEACICPPVKPSTVVPLSTLMKIGSIVVHADEFLAPQGGHEFDRVTLMQLLRDPEVVAWVKSMGELLPVKR